MKLPELFKTKSNVLSYELFPPKTDQGQINLFDHLDKLCRFAPDFVTCTYGAGGSTQTKTLDIISKVKEKFQLPVASHLTLVGSSVDQLREYLDSARERGIDYIVALRGDPPKGQDKFSKAEGGLSYANELVSLIRDEFRDDFSVAVAGYPEKHQEAPSMDADLENLKRKVDAGADIIVTQLFYDNEDFFRFNDRCRKTGIDIPIVPGILPVTSYGQIQRITSMCEAKLPTEFVQRLTQFDDKESQFRAGVDLATEQVSKLIERGVPGIHFYVLNQSRATIEVLKSTHHFSDHFSE